ncbi:nickel pincer cofactor biosynthesis protein LarB [Desulfovibrio ferrophilus]|uniref:1-(5-phosphoribosyl)-5-amino-4-imidazole-carboxylate AIR carboxylase n=1 Tax=Desulfovibrio ferrophilus TaxID=241368 RepID=A0A2Z6B028_9BACT|nr:nickel pincer cofactor biosynthesis protein LarB [Desulfovibrio ferrophilus]BBD08795.1 1-(5-phosphoribosyl)-5-amino-4-imidazole-carboxylate AIR carboxylase [Desulfovibrio ferrophilus]
MTEKNIHDVLEQVSKGLLSPDEALGQFQNRPLGDLAQGINLDAHRLSRTGLGEVVFATGKTPAQIVACVQGLQDHGPVLATRVGNGAATALTQTFPNGHYHELSGLFALGADLGLTPPWPQRGEVLVATAGTSDLSVALEAYGCARFFGLDCGLIADVGVAGVHRLTPHLPALRAAQVVIAVAGMDGALPSVLAGLLPTPVIAVPSSQNSGNPLGGISSLLAMLNSCSPGITVSNIDNGFGAAAFAAKLLKTHPAE